MGAGDTIAGTIRVTRTMQDGSKQVVLSGIASARADEDVAGNVYVNVRPGTQGVQAAGDVHLVCTQKFFEGERLGLEISAAALAEAVAYDTAGSQKIGVIKRDINTGRKWQDSLLTANTALGADPTSVVGTYVEFFAYTVPAQQVLQLAGLFHAIAPENA